MNFSSRIDQFLLSHARINLMDQKGDAARLTFGYLGAKSGTMFLSILIHNKTQITNFSQSYPSLFGGFT
jgi:hypothetical protein